MPAPAAEDLAKGLSFRFDSCPSNGFTEYSENAIEFGPTGTSEGFLKCLRFISGRRKVGHNTVTDGGPRAVASDICLEGLSSDCNVAMFNIASMSNDCRDRGTCTISSEGEGVEFEGYLWSSRAIWPQDAMVPLE